MGRKSQEAELTAAMKEYLEAIQNGKPGQCKLDVKHVATALGISRTSIYKYGLDKLIREAQQRQTADDGNQSHSYSDMLVGLRQALKQAELRNKALLTRLNLVEANAARLGIDPEELYQSLVKPVRVVSHVGRTKKPV